AVELDVAVDGADAVGRIANLCAGGAKYARGNNDLTADRPGAAIQSHDRIGAGEGNRRIVLAVILNGGCALDGECSSADLDAAVATHLGVGQADFVGAGLGQGVWRA